MRAYLVVELYHAGDALFCGLPVGEQFLVVYPFRLEDAVHALGDGVVGGLVAFGHANPYVVSGEGVHVAVAGVLRAAVGDFP